MTNDPFILQTVRGLKVKFIEKPVQNIPRITQVFGRDSIQIVQNEIDSLLKKGAIIPVEPVQGQFVSTLFLVDKKSGGKRPVINLRPLNRFIEKEHFKMSGLKQVLELIEEGDFLVTIDLKDAYFSVSIDAKFRKYFRFSWMGQLFEFLVMCFGLTTAPFIFTRLTKPLMAYLHARNIRASIYIDDCITMAKTYTQAIEYKDTTVQLFKDVGFTVNFEKSSLFPSHQKVYLGFVIDTMLMKIFLTQEKLEELLRALHCIIQENTVSIQKLARIIGLIVAAFPAFYQGPLHYRQLERLKTQQLYIHKDWAAPIAVSLGAREDITWWLDHAESQNGKPIRPPVVGVVLASDASGSGWGAVLGSTMASGIWSQEQSQLHINVREMLAVQLGLLQLASHISNKHIQLQIDNTTVVSYLNRMGGTHSLHLDNLAQAIWGWALLRNIHLSAVHIPGKSNICADYLSRVSQDRSGWMLNRLVFRRLCSMKFLPQVDLFASHLNAQLPQFVSWRPHHQAWAVDALSLTWSNIKAYAFPPFLLINKVIQKVRAEQAHLLLITPNWPTQPWWPALLSLSVSHPVLITPRENLLTLPPTNTNHPMGVKLQLVAWEVSGNIIDQRAYRTELQKSFSPHGELKLPSNTKRLGASGVAGVIEEGLIPFVHL